MNDNAIESIEIDIIKWILSIAATSAVLGAIFWSLFYSSFFANLYFIIPLRDRYQDTYWKVEGIFLKSQRDYPPFNSIYTIQVRGVMNNSYIYRFSGYFLGVDWPKGIISLRDGDGTSYYFKLSRRIMEQTDEDHANLKREASLPNSIIWITWGDTRSLYKIEGNLPSSPSNVVNPNSLDNFSLVINK